MKVTINAPKGLYLYGGVGTGKTFVMDLFYDNIPVEKRRRVHFNAFMLDVHDRLHKLRAKGRHKGDPLETIVDDLMNQAWLLCFDEFQVTDVADAMILKRLFSGMLARGAVMVSTSNRPPSDLYLNGLQRNLFLPFIDLLKDKHLVHDMNSRVDFRLLRRSLGAADTYFISRPSATAQERDEALYLFFKARRELTKGQEMVTVDLTLQGRRLRLPQVALSTRTACMTFQELCGMPLGAADYIKLGNTVSTLFVTDVPIMTIADVNVLRRFITLIDCLYEAKADVVILAQGEPKQLFDASSYKESSHDEVFAFDRTVSRLMEMQGDDYWQRTRRPVGAELVAEALQESPPGGGSLKEGSARALLRSVWDYYDIDESNTWNHAKFHAFVEDLSEVRLKRRQVAWDKEVQVFKSIADEKGLMSFDNLCHFWEEDQHNLIESDVRIPAVEELRAVA